MSASVDNMSTPVDPNMIGAGGYGDLPIEACGIAENRIGDWKVAIIHDWLYTIGGAERVLSAITRCFPNATVYTLFDTLTDNQRAEIGHFYSPKSFWQLRQPIASRHRLYLPLMPLAIEHFDLSNYDLVISSSHAVAKG